MPWTFPWSAVVQMGVQRHAGIHGMDMERNDLHVRLKTSN